MGERARREVLELSSGALATALAGCFDNNSGGNGSEEDFQTVDMSYRDVVSDPEAFVADNRDHYSDTDKVRFDEPVELALEDNDKVYLRTGHTGDDADTEKLHVHVFDGEPASYEGCVEGEIPIFRQMSSDQELPESVLSEECEGEEANLEGYVVDTYRPTTYREVDEGYGFLVTDWGI